MVEVKWTSNALEELDDIAIYISKASPNYAHILINQIYEMVGHLTQLFEYFLQEIGEKNFYNVNLIFK